MTVIEKIAELAVKRIQADFTGRRGLRQEWEGIDDDIRDEIIVRWKDLVGRSVVDVLYSEAKGDA